MQKLDLTKKYKNYYSAKLKPELVEFGEACYISITGKGDPSDQLFGKSVEALYTIAYTIKFAYKSVDKDFVVSKLEGIWWYDEIKYPGKQRIISSMDIPRSEWEYRLLIRMPEYFSKDVFKKSIDTVITKKRNELARQVEYFILSQGKYVQMLHVGPFSTEPESIRQIVSFMEAHHLIRNGKHHEIYLSDFRKTVPEKLKTILREPVQ